jgi:hypothetical protein
MSQLFSGKDKCYFFSRNKEIYRAIAREYHTSLFHVYRLAHGKRGRSNRDYYIVKKLKEQGVIVPTFRG